MAAKAARQLRLATLAILMKMLDYVFFCKNWAHQSAISFGIMTKGRCDKLVSTAQVWQRLQAGCGTLSAKTDAKRS